MNAEIRVIRTAAETALAEAFATAKPRLPGAAPIAALREDAFRTFERRGLPSRRVEEWKYTDLRAAMPDLKPLAGMPDAAAKERAKAAGELLAGVEARRLTFVDGAFVAELSDLKGLEAGLTIRSLAEALAANDALVAQHVGQVVPVDDPAVALNTAFMGDGAVIRVAAGSKIKRPIHLAFVNTSPVAVATFLRSLVVIEDDAEATLIESHEGPAGNADQVNAALELIVGDRARLDHVKVIAGASPALHVASLMASVGAEAQLESFAFVTGGAVVRNQMFVRIGGEKSRVGLRGSTLLKDRQHADTTLVIDHAGVGGESREVFKSVLDGESRGVFQGKIIVEPHAQKTDGKMAAHALLLSEEAEADAKPELEIFADDVQCGHGATAGALDEDLLFYLKARGIPTKEAESLLIQAFVGEAVEAIGHEGVRDALMAAVVRWLEERAA